jgi:hypothetical protein
VTGADLIIAALTAGAVAGTTDVASAAVRDAYAGLRERLRQRLSGHSHSHAALDSYETGPGVQQTMLAEALNESGAAEGSDVLAAAQQVLELVDPTGIQAGKYQVDARQAKGVQVGNHNTQTNTFS